MSKIVARQVVVSALLGCVTCWVVAHVSDLPYSPVRDRIRDALSLPGALIAMPFFPAGVHTGNGSFGWAVMAVVGNGVFYSALWLLALLAIRRQRAVAKSGTRSL